MAIINPTPTTADYQAQTKTQITNSINNLYRQMQNTYTVCMNRVWKNTYGLSPQNVLDSFGTDASGLFNYATQLAGLVNSIVPNTLVPMSGLPSVTFNSDGSVSVGA